jgi:hypothetical protein
VAHLSDGLAETTASIAMRAGRIHAPAMFMDM